MWDDIIQNASFGANTNGGKGYPWDKPSAINGG